MCYTNCLYDDSSETDPTKIHTGGQISNRLVEINLTENKIKQRQTDKAKHNGDVEKPFAESTRQVDNIMSKQLLTQKQNQNFKNFEQPGYTSSINQLFKYFVALKCRPI